MPFIDNGDGTITTEDGIRIAKPLGMGDPYRISGRENGYRIPGKPGIIDNYSRTQDALDDWQKDQDAYQRPASLDAPAGPLQPSRALIDAARRGPDERTADASDVIRNALAPPSAPDAPRAPLDMKRLLSQEEAAKITPEAKASAGPAGDAAKAAAALGVGEPGLPKGLKPAVRASGESGTVAPEDRVQVAGNGYSIPNMGPQRVIDKGGMRAVQKEIKEGVALPDDIKQGMADNVLTHRAANEAGRLASEQENAQTSAAATGYASTAEQQLAKEQERAALHQRTMQEAMTKFDAMSNEARAKPINDDSYWQEKGAGARVLSGLFVAMGELSKGKGENTAKSIIDKQVDTWVASKRESRAQGLAGQQTLMNQARDNFQSESAQNAAMRAQAYDAYRAKLGAITANAATEKEKAQALALDADLQDKALAERTKAAEMEADHVTVHQKLIAPTVTGANPPFAKNDGSFVDLPGGKSIKASNPEMANQWRQQVDAIGETKNAIRELNGLLADPNFKDSGRVKVLLNNIAVSAGASKLGSSRQTGMGELENLQKIFNQEGPVSSDIYGRTRSALGAVNASAQAAEDRIMKSAPVYSAPQPTQTGDLIRYQMFPNGSGGQVPIAFNAVGKGGKRHKK